MEADRQSSKGSSLRSEKTNLSNMNLTGNLLETSVMNETGSQNSLNHSPLELNNGSEIFYLPNHKPIDTSKS